MDEVDECVGSLKEFSREKAANRHGLKVIMQDRFVADASKAIFIKLESISRQHQNDYPFIQYLSDYERNNVHNIVRDE